MGSFLLDTVVKPAGEAAKATSGTTQSTGLFGTWMTDHPVMLIVVYCVVLLVIMYFLSIRPLAGTLQKRDAPLESAGGYR